MSGSFGSKTIKLLRISGIVIIGLILAAAAFRLSIEPSSSRRVERYVTELKAKGYRTTPQEVLPVIPKERNGAVLWNEMLSRDEDLIKIDPALVKGKKGGLRMEAIGPLASLSAEERTRLIRGIQFTSVFLDTLRRIAACPEFGLAPQDFSKPITQWQGLKLVGMTKDYRILFTMAALWGMEGRTKEALDLWRLGVQSSRHLLRQPTSMVSFILGCLVKSLAISSIQSICSGHTVSSIELQKAIGDLNNVSSRQSFINLLEWERVYQFKVTTEIMNGDYASFDNPQEKENPTWGYRGELALVWAMRPLMRRDLVTMQEMLLEQRRILDKPTWEWVAGNQRFSEKIRKESPPRWHFLYAAIAPRILDFNRHVQGYLDIEAHNQVVRLGLACRAYHNDHGKWPEKLADVTPKYLPALPLDPCTGKPFSYTVAKDGILITGGGAAYGKGEAIAWSDGVMKD